MERALSYDEWILKLEKKVNLLPKVQAVISNFQVLPRLGKLLEKKSQSCDECKIFWLELQKSTIYIDEFFNDGNTFQKDFDDLVSKIIHHLKNKHSIKAKGLILSIYTSLGMLIGVFIGYVVSATLLAITLKAGLALGWLMGVLIGWFVGKLKEKKLGRQNLLF